MHLLIHKYFKQTFNICNNFKIRAYNNTKILYSLHITLKKGVVYETNKFYKEYKLCI